MLRSDIRTAVKDTLGLGPAGDGLLSDTVLNRLIDRAITVISAERSDWWWLRQSVVVTFSAANGNFSLPTDFVRVDYLTYNGQIIPKLPMRLALDTQRTPLSLGWYVYSTTGGPGNIQLAVAPPPLVPGLQGTLWYFRSEPSLAADGSEPVMPREYQETIVIKACELASMVRQDPQRMAMFAQAYALWMKRLRAANKEHSGHQQRIISGNETSSIVSSWG